MRDSHNRTTGQLEATAGSVPSLIVGALTVTASFSICKSLIRTGVFASFHIRAITNMVTLVSALVLSQTREMRTVSRATKYGAKRMTANDPPDHFRKERAFQPVTWFEALADSQRQSILWYLSQQPGTVSIDELVEQTAHWSGESVPTLRLSMYHLHLPKLADAELIRYDTEQGIVERTVTTDRVTALLDDYLIGSRSTEQ